MAGVLVTLFGLLVLELVYPMRIWPRPERPVEMQSSLFLCRIGVALAHFKDRNEGQLPRALDELVPRHVASDDVKWFYPPYTGRLSELSHAPPEQQVRGIEQEGAYVYLGAAGELIDCIMYERAEVLPKGAFQVNVLTRELSTRRIPLAELKDRLRRLGADHEP